jgi:hypothetical protein
MKHTISDQISPAKANQAIKTVTAGKVFRWDKELKHLCQLQTDINCILPPFHITRRIFLVKSQHIVSLTNLIGKNISPSTIFNK